MIERAVILSTGDELTTGKVIDTNSSTIADRLFAVGVEVAAVLSVADDRSRLHWALGQARELGDLIVGTGGLGPTADDLTTEVVAEFLGCKLKQDKEVAGVLKRRFAARGIAWTPNNLKQALFPEGSFIVPNPVGTAPGFRVPLGRDKTLIWLSGVPQEMTAMLNETVVPWILDQGSEEINSHTFKIYGLTESKLDDLMKPVDLGSTARLSFRAHYPDLSLRLMVRGRRESAETFTRLKDQIRIALGSHIYCEGDRTLEEVVGQLLLAKRQTLALAESCTGGYISHRITRVAGSSAYYYGGAVTYSNDAKIRFLSVKPTTLESYGAVSRETALEMSRGIKERTGTDIGLSVTGVAGPLGGSPEKPVGTVWMSIAQEGSHEAKLFKLHGERERIISGASQSALHWLRTTLLSESH
ncbi:MAG TPA: competence/damage-inducible protein A [Candidatus Binatia bacterium]|nr:competence/damage-inducible protein A [Candidatus Binatia bacterium]